jgi:hypothetical protein
MQPTQRHQQQQTDLVTEYWQPNPASSRSEVSSFAAAASIDNAKSFFHFCRHQGCFLSDQNHEALKFGVDGVAQFVILRCFEHQLALISGIARSIRHALAITPLFQYQALSLNLLRVRLNFKNQRFGSPQA